MKDFTTEELNQIMLGLCNQHVALRDCVANTSHIPDVKAHWMAKLEAVTAAYNKVQTQYLKQSAEEIRQSLNIQVDSLDKIL